MSHPLQVSVCQLIIGFGLMLLHVFIASPTNLPSSREVRAGGKSFYFDVEKNDRGTFVRLTEVTNLNSQIHYVLVYYKYKYCMKTLFIIID